MKRALPLIIIIAVFGAALGTAWYLRSSTSESPRIVPRDGSASKSRTGSVRQGADPAHTLGSIDAPVMLEEFGDFECQPCGSLHPILKALKAEFGPRLVIVYRQFPLVAAHPHALAAARAAEAAGLQGKFWEMHNLLYENQKTWHDASDAEPLFEEYATRIGLPLDRFKQDRSSALVEQRIALDRERGSWIGVNSTPTVFLNGKEVLPESLSHEKLRTLINAEISSAGK